jgi:hypothetical protein
MDELRLIDGLYGLVMLLLGGLGVLFFDAMRQHKADTSSAIAERKREHDKLNEKVDRRDAEITAKIATVSEDLGRNYMPRTEIAALMNEIKGGLLRIETKIDGKVDKL